MPHVSQRFALKTLALSSVHFWVPIRYLALGKPQPSAGPNLRLNVKTIIPLFQLDFQLLSRPKLDLLTVVIKRHKMGHHVKLNATFQRWLHIGVRKVTETLITYDPAEDLNNPEAIAIFLTEALKTQDAAYIAHAIGVIARAQGMSNLAQETGLSREQLYRSYSKQGNPTLKSTLAVLKSLGLQLSVESSGGEETARQPAQ